MLVSEAATHGEREDREAEVIMLNDVARAFSMRQMQRKFCVVLPEDALEGKQTREVTVGATTNEPFYGTPDAAVNLQGK